MIGRSVILLCIAAIFVAIESKPLHSQYKSIHKNGNYLTYLRKKQNTIFKLKKTKVLNLKII